MEAKSNTSQVSEQSVETLFITKNVQEIKQEERQTRLDIERKREELRQLVGERYHDMIEAADSVIKMKHDANNVIDTLSNVQECCKELQQVYLLKGTGGHQAPPTIGITQTASAQMKLIIDTQYQIWNSLEENNNLSASLCYLIMRNGSMRMRTLESMEWPNIMNQFTQRIITFKSTIIMSCREYFKKSSLSLNDKTIDSFVSLLLVEGCGLEKAISWFLEDRIIAIEHVFATKVQSVKSCIKEVITILRNTLLLIYHLFIPTDTTNDSLIIQHLNKITNKQQQHQEYCRNLIPIDLVARLPDFIINYTPQLSVCDLSHTIINSIVTKWIERCNDITNANISKNLIHITNIKGLTIIRNNVHQILSEPSFATNDNDETDQILTSIRVDWSNTCQGVLNNQLNLYNRFIRQLLLDRAKDILTFQLNELQSYMKDLLQQLVARQQSNPDNFIHDTNLSHLLWATTDERDIVGGAEYETCMITSLKMKAKGCTPQINYFCTSISSKLQCILDDLNHFLSDNNNSTDIIQHVIQQQHGDEYPFYKFADVPLLIKTLGGLITTTINRFVTVVESIASNIITDIDNVNNDNNELTILQDRLLLLSRLCLCLVDFTPNLKHILSIQDESPWKPQQSSSWKSSRGTGNVTSLQSSFVLEEQANGLLLKWSKSLSKTFCRLFSDYIMNDTDTHQLSSATVWDHINITEETEEGNKVSTNVQLPSQASVYIVTILYALSQEISRVGGHFITRSVLNDMMLSVFIGVTELYMEYYNNDTIKHFNQQSTLQTLFNYRFISSILWYPASDPIAAKHTKLVDIIVSNIDPFDYDVFAPHLTRLLNRQLQRSTVMFGILLNVKENTSFFNQPISSSTTESHIIIPLSTSLPRIPPLPSSNNTPLYSKEHNTISSNNLSSMMHPSFFNISTALHSL